MADDLWSKDVLEFMQRMWNPMSFPLPGMVTPTLSIEELDRKLAELKSVESWLKMNLVFLEMTIKTLEMQRSALQALSTPPSAAPKG